MPWALDDRFRTAENRAIIAFIERANPSAHDNVASVLAEAAKGLSGVRRYCPDLHRYAYVVVHTQNHRIFGIAFGMNALAYRIPKEIIPEAIAEDGEIYSEIGEEWVLFHPWPADEPAEASFARLKRWCKTAHDYAVGAKAPGRR